VIEKAGYGSNLIKVENVEFELFPGQLIGLIGSNGAGKSTTLQAMMGVLPFVKGEFSIPDYGYVPERPIFYEYFTLWEHIDFYIRSQEQEEEILQKRAWELLNLLKLDKVVHDLPSTFSKGMQQKVMLLLAFLEEKPFYILDEPFMGLDPTATKLLLKFIEIEKKRGAAILISTHALDTAEKICDSFILLNEGTILKKGTLTSFREELHNDSLGLLDIFDQFLAVGEVDDCL